MKIAALVGTTLLLAVPLAASAQDASTPSGDLLLLATTRTGTMGKELDDVASRNYRVLSAAGGVGTFSVGMRASAGVGSCCISSSTTIATGPIGGVIAIL